MRILATLAAICLVTLAARGSEQSLFNGKDLDGWDGKPGWWHVEGGALTVESTPEKPCKKCNYLIWKGGEPADFELTADFRLSEKSNSGIQIRSERRPDWDTFGYQADMTGNGGLVGFIYHHKRGLIVQFHLMTHGLMREGTVHGPGVHKSDIELSGQKFCDRAFTRSSRSVDRDHHGSILFYPRSLAWPWPD